MSEELSRPNAAPDGAGRALSAEMLVRRYGRAVFALCLARSDNVHDAEDAMQEALLKAIRNLPSLRDPAKARPWLMQIARRACVDRIRRRRPDGPMPDQLAAPADAEPGRFESLRAAIARLTEDQREVVMLYYMDGRNSASVAETLGISPSAVRRRLVRARLRLHELLTEDDR
ncbi:MAG: RNA polymerase sigma factor [Planctomycetota bacterium]|jgi:RNA polymerase sigma-70 factor (ECF subfamily)